MNAPQPAFPAGAAAPIEARGIRIVSDDGVERVANVTLEVHAGEILGVAAIEGSGQHHLLRALAGRQEVRAGTLRIPSDVGYIPADRHRDAVMLNRDLAENVALRGAATRAGVVGWKDLRTRTLALMQAFDVRAPSAAAPMRTLSGGNQQKLVLARELAAASRSSAGPRAIVADNPTRGLDVRATAAVHEHLLTAAGQGAAVVVYSSDLDELLALSTRIIVLRGGRSHDVALDRNAIGRVMIGA